MSLKKIKSFFSTYEFKDEEIRLDKGVAITNPKKYYEAQIRILEANTGNKLYLPYYNRLLKFYNIIKNGKD